MSDPRYEDRNDSEWPDIEDDPDFYEDWDDYDGDWWEDDE